VLSAQPTHGPKVKGGTTTFRLIPVLFWAREVLRRATAQLVEWVLRGGVADASIRCDGAAHGPNPATSPPIQPSKYIFTWQRLPPPPQSATALVAVPPVEEGGAPAAVEPSKAAFTFLGGEAVECEPVECDATGGFTYVLSKSFEVTPGPALIQQLLVTPLAVTVFKAGPSSSVLLPREGHLTL
jgi:hypothetical protein